MKKNLKEIFLKEALKFVPIYGWSTELISNVEANISYHNIFTSVKDLVSFHMEQNDLVMLKKLKKTEFANLKVRDKIKHALLIRFELNDHAVIKETATYLVKPQNSKLALISLANSCDKIWIFAGDNSTDFNYYTKRTLLAAIYSASLAFYLKKSETEPPTKEELEIFITNRITETLKIGELKMKIKDKIASLFKKD